MLQQAGMALLAIGALLLVDLGHRHFGLAAWYILDDAYGQFGTLGGELRFVAWVVLGTFCVLPAAFLLGMSFPIAQKAVQQDLGQVGRRVGPDPARQHPGQHRRGAGDRPRPPARRSAPPAPCSWSALPASCSRWSLADEHRRPWTIGVAAALGLCLILLPGNRALWAAMHGSEAGRTLVEEDRTGVAVVLDRPVADAPGAQALYVGGRWQSQMNPYSPVQGALGLLAAWVHPDPKSVLVIGYGGGGSVWAVDSNPGDRARSTWSRSSSP